MRPVEVTYTVHGPTAGKQPSVVNLRGSDSKACVGMEGSNGEGCLTEAEFWVGMEKVAGLSAESQDSF